ncbi:MAG: DNA-directed RNA polymerase subunit B [Nitrososphaerota archaeon]|nr:DNA-directed RNA polymerase subunit B [Nitrososphaerota archaeon]MDG6939355.1 DNA-directed RNA polymerase subunit B [Nitrososphaerota archaeon]
MEQPLKYVDGWPIIEDLLKREGVARQHLNSYNEFISRGVQSIVDEVAETDIETATGSYKIRFGRVNIGKPRVVEIDGSTSFILPMEARLRNLSYVAPIQLEITIVDQQLGPTGQYSQTYQIGDLPVMAKSNLCALHALSEEELIEASEDPKDPGGYFIINGSERVIVGLEDLSPNKILVESDKSSGKTTYKAKIYSSIVGYRSKLELELKPDGAIFVKLPASPVDLPFVTILRALGLGTDKQAADIVSMKPAMQDLLEASFDKASEALTSQDSLMYIGNRVAHGMMDELRLKRAEMLLDWYLLPHLGRQPSNRLDKAAFLGEAACKLLELKLGLVDEDDKDHYGNKVIKFAGQMLADLFRTAFRNMVRDMKYQLDRAGQKRGGSVVNSAIRPGIISDKLANAIATGNWGRGKVGVTQLLDRTNYLSTLSHLRRIQSPLSRSQPNFEARDLHSTHFGRICPNETPEGSNCGLVKNLALSAVISVTSSTFDVMNKPFALGVVRYSEADDDLRTRGAKVFIDGRLMGYVDDAQRLATAFRRLRRKGEIPVDVSIYAYDPGREGATVRVYISSTAGRVLRPLIVVEGGRALVDGETVDRIRKGTANWRDLVGQGLMELLDANEEENAYIALTPSEATAAHTHLEPYPPAMLGVAGALIPYPEHNQSPRNTYESAMAKQALGFSTSSFMFTSYVRQHLAAYPQAPLVRTKANTMGSIDERPMGQNAVVAVLSFEGYNIEDAVILNRASVERGLGRTFFYRLYEAEAQQYLGGMKDKFEIPSPDDNVRGFRGEKFYRLLEEDGTIAAESVVGGGDVLTGRTSPPRFMEEYKEFEVRGPYRRDTSVAVRPSEAGVVDAVFMTQSVDGNKSFKIRVRDQRIPELGDKFASRHGQKGVVGMLVNQEDLPYTKDGVVPDAIINPHAFPSRMTVGQFLESVGGKAASLRGEPVDGTSFLGERPGDIKDLLEERGFKSSGKEIMYDGRTGRPFMAEVFIGVVYYQKLHHMVADKIHARARGQVQMLTKQPTEGRARGGGLRFGEMERDCLIAYGAAMVLKDRLLEESDKTEVHICERCGLISYYDGKQRKYVCKVCGDSAKISTVPVAYAFKLLLQEMMSLVIAPRLRLRDKV